MALTASDVVAKPQLAAIPEELKQYDRWLLWKAEPDRKNPELLAKVPKDIRKRNFTNWQNVDNLYSFEQIEKALQTGYFDGIGFSPVDTPFLCIDLDNDNSLQDIPQELQDITQAGYAEISPSGKGIHVWMRAEVPEGTGRKRKTPAGDTIELFSNSGWLTITGNAINQNGVEAQQPFVDTIIKKYGFKESQQATQTQSFRQAETSLLSEHEVITKMLNSKDAPAIRALLSGDISAYDNDFSSADFALCTRLAFWTGKDPALMDAIFRSSGLYRPEKWDRKTGNTTYGRLTIQKAIQAQQEVYTGSNGDEPYSLSIVATPKAAPAPSKEEQLKNEVAQMDLSKLTLDDLTPEQISVLDKETAKALYLRSSADHFIQSFVDGVTASVDTPAIPTGFQSLDEILEGGLYEGLYIVGAISSLGKTTLIMQIADQIAEQGQDVIIFSLEMARTEIMAKSISRLTLMNALADGKKENNAKTTRGITAGKRYAGYNTSEKQLIAKSIRDYNSYAGSLYIQEGIGDIGVMDVRETVERHKEYTGNTPVVVIDYLQILAPHDPRATDKQNTDKAVLELKRISRDFKTPVIGISSFNRENYKQPVSMASFKESGAIEYSSDVLIGLQLAGMVDGEGKIKDNFDVDTEKAKDPRKIMLKILKNRNGATGKVVHFDYHPKFNYFVDKGTIYKASDSSKEKVLRL